MAKKELKRNRTTGKEQYYTLPEIVDVCCKEVIEFCKKQNIDLNKQTFLELAGGTGEFYHE